MPEINTTAFEERIAKIMVSYSQSVTLGDSAVTRSASIETPLCAIGKNLSAEVDAMLEMLKTKTAKGTNANSA